MYLCRDIRKKRTDQVNKANNNITEQSTKGKVKDLPTLQFWSKSHYRFWPIMQIRKKGGIKFKKKSSPLNLLRHSYQTLREMVLWWSPFKFVSVSSDLYPRRPPLLKIEISSNGQNCSILSQKVPKFELYKHNDELFNTYYVIFYELWTFAYFDRLWKLEKRGDEIKKILLLWNYWANLKQILLKWSLGGPLSKLCPSASSCIQDGRHD